MALAYNFKNIREWVNTEGGLAEYALIAPKSWFTATGLKYPQGPFGITPGDSLTIKEAHEFLEGKAFIYFALAPDKNELNTTTTGEKGFYKPNSEIKLVMPGSTPAQHEQLRALLNTPLVAIIKDGTCGANMYYQLGSDCAAAYMKSDFKSGTTDSGIKGFECSITYANGPLFYDVTGGPEILAD